MTQSSTSICHVFEWINAIQQCASQLMRIIAQHNVIPRVFKIANHFPFCHNYLFLSSADFQQVAIPPILNTSIRHIQGLESTAKILRFLKDIRIAKD